MLLILIQNDNLFRYVDSDLLNSLCSCCFSHRMWILLRCNRGGKQEILSIHHMTSAYCGKKVVEH